MPSLSAASVQARRPRFNPVGQGLPSCHPVRRTRRRGPRCLPSYFVRVGSRPRAGHRWGSLSFRPAMLAHRLRRRSCFGPRQAETVASSSARSPLVGSPCGSLGGAISMRPVDFCRSKRLDHEHPCTRCSWYASKLTPRARPARLVTALTTRRRACARDARAVPSQARHRNQGTSRFTTLGPLSRDDRRPGAGVVFPRRRDRLRV